MFSVVWSRWIRLVKNVYRISGFIKCKIMQVSFFVIFCFCIIMIFVFWFFCNAPLLSICFLAGKYLLQSAYLSSGNRGSDTGSNYFLCTGSPLLHVLPLNLSNSTLSAGIWMWHWGRVHSSDRIAQDCFHYFSF